MSNIKQITARVIPFPYDDDRQERFELENDILTSLSRTRDEYGGMALVAVARIVKEALGVVDAKALAELILEE